MSTNQDPSIVGGALGVEKDLTPEQIVERGDWSKQQKLDRLEKMKLDAIEKQRAANEGMAGDESANLRAIELAIDAVKSDAAGGPETDAIAGRRLG